MLDQNISWHNIDSTIYVCCDSRTNYQPYFEYTSHVPRCYPKWIKEKLFLDKFFTKLL